ncbi:MAG: transposase [Selenomonas sp.]|nr:transposase [Selenomonas sp.]
MQYQSEGDGTFIPFERNRVYKTELKIQAVLSYLNGEGSLLDICKKYGIHSKHQLQSWIKVYNAHGDLNYRKYSVGGSYMSKARSPPRKNDCK